MNNIDLDINNYTQNELQRFLKLKDTYSNDELNSQISKFILKIVDNSYPNEYKEKLIFFTTSIKDRLQIKNVDKNDKQVKEVKEVKEDDYEKDYSKILSEIIDTKIGDIIKTYNNINHNPLQYQKLDKSTLNSYNEKTITENYVFNTRFRNDFLNSIPQQCIFQLPNPINNVLRLSLLSIQIPNVMLAFSKAKFTTQIYIKEDITNYAATVVIPDGNYDETTFPGILEKNINEQVINPFILPVNYRFFVTIDPYTLYVTIKNTFYTFTMEIITNFLNQLGNCALGYNLSSTNLNVPQTYNSTVQFNISANNIFNITNSYNTSTTVSDVFLKDSKFNVKKIYEDPLYSILELIYFTLNSIITGTLVLDAALNQILDIKFKTLGATFLYVPLKLISIDIDNSYVSLDNTIKVKGVKEYYYKHNALFTANLLNAQVDPVIYNYTNTYYDASGNKITENVDLPYFYSNKAGPYNITRNHIYTLKIYPNKTFELIQTNWGIMNTRYNPFYKDFTIYTNTENWVNHNTNVNSISYNPFFVNSSIGSQNSFTPRLPEKVPTILPIIPNGYTQESGLFHMMSGNIFVSQEPNALYSLTFEILMTHNPYTDLYTFPSAKSATLTSSLPEVQTDPQLICKSKIGNLSGAYNYRFNDFDVKNKVSEISISNTLGYQIGYRLIQYAGFKSYTSESAFDKTSLDYVYFSVDDYNNSYLNHNYGVLPNQSILDENILAIVTIRSPQFTTTFDNGSDYIPKLRYYFTPVNIKKIAIKLLDPLGNLVNINTNDYSFVLEVTKLMDIKKI